MITSATPAAVPNLVHIRRRVGGGGLLDKWVKYNQFGATVCKTVHPMLSDRCLSVSLCCPVCPVCDVGVLWPNGGWIKMPLGMKVGLGAGDFLLDGDPAPLPKNGGGAPQIFGRCLLWPNGCMDQDAT